MTPLDFPDNPAADEIFSTPKIDFIFKTAPDRWRRQVASPPVLSLVAVSPDRGPTYNDTTAISVYGTGFTAASVITWGSVGNIPTTYVSETELRGTAPLNDTAGEVGVWVFEGGAYTPEDVKYTYELPIPTLISLTPDWIVPPNPNPGRCRIVGTGFTPDTAIWWDVWTPFKTYIDPQNIDVDITMNNATPRTVPVWATPSMGGGTESNRLEFDYLVTAPPALVPIPQSLTPSSIVQGTTAANLTVNGQNFESGDRIIIDGVAQATTFISATQLRTTSGHVAPFSIKSALVNVERSVSPNLTLNYTAAPGSVGDIAGHVAPGAWPYSGMSTPPWNGNCYCELLSGNADANCIVHMDGLPYPSWPEGTIVWFTPNYAGHDPNFVWRAVVTVVKNGVPSSNSSILPIGGS